MSSSLQTSLSSRQLWVMIAVLSSLAANCQQCSQTPSPQRGNVDRVADVVLVDGLSKDDPTPHTFAVLSNPELGYVRVLDLTIGDFVLAPNQYFPLSVPVGSHTTALTTAVDITSSVGHDHARIFALDGADDVLHVLCTPAADGCDGFSTLTQIPTGRAPSDVAAIRTSADDILVVITLPGSNQVASAVMSRTDSTLRGDWTVLDLPGAQAPTVIAADPLGESFVVADAIAPLLFVLQRNGNNELSIAQTISLLSPTIALSAGVVDVGDGLAPVVLVSGAPPATVSAVRLYRSGFREDRYALLGSQELSLPAAAVYVPDQRLRSVGDVAEPTPIVCCRGLSTEQIDAGEASASWGSVWLADGNVLHVRIDATGVRLFDDNALDVAAFDDIDWNADDRLWTPAVGGEAFRPVVAIVDAVRQQDRRFIQSLSTLRLEYEAVLPSLDGAEAQWDGATLTSASLSASGRRDGDDITITGNDGCTFTTTMMVAGDDAVAVMSDDDCLTRAPLAITVRSRDGFVVTNDLRFLGVVTDAAGDAPLLPLADRALELRFAAAGAPVRGSVLSLPIAPNVVPFGLRLATRTLDAFGQAALVPTAIAGGIMTIPGLDQVPTRTRRMVLTSAGGDELVRSVVLSCDEAETSISRVDNVR